MATRLAAGQDRQKVIVATGISIFILMGAMAAGWLSRRLLLDVLRTRHPREFESLGNPSHKQLSSLSPRNREVQVSFWRYLWEGKAFLLKDGLVSGLAWVALISDAVLVAGAVLLVWSVATQVR
jgi:hypothetical protein